jgi:DNA-directed RNA polymerase subunit RPC12/RpoP
MRPSAAIRCVAIVVLVGCQPAEVAPIQVEKSTEGTAEALEENAAVGLVRTLSRSRCEPCAFRRLLSERSSAMGSGVSSSLRELGRTGLVDTRIVARSRGA